MNWLMDRINAIFRAHEHKWRRARKDEDKAFKYCRCGHSVAVKKRKANKEAT